MKKKRRLLATVVLLALLACGVWRGNTRIVVETFPYTSAHLPAAFDGFRVVQLSDLHGRQFGAGNERLADAVRRARPDIIAITGDLVDAESDVSDVIPLIEKLMDAAPVYYVTGNHEWGSGQALTVVRTLRELGVTCLENEFVRVERGGEHLLVAGVHDPNGFADQKTPEQLAEELYAQVEAPYWLLLAHRNSLFNGRYCRLGADLTLCGHAHGGIWRLPFTDGLLSTDKQFFPSFTSGFYNCTDGGHESAAVFVSRGWVIRRAGRSACSIRRRSRSLF